MKINKNVFPWLIIFLTGACVFALVFTIVCGHHQYQMDSRAECESQGGTILQDMGDPGGWVCLPASHGGTEQ